MKSCTASLIFGCLLAARPAGAICPALADTNAALARQSLQSRVTFLRTTLEDQRTRTNWWNVGFVTLGFAAGATQVSLAFATDQDGEPGESNRRAFLLVNGGRGLLAGTWTLLMPLRIADASVALTPRDDCAWLARAEADLLATAQFQRQHRSPLGHLVVAVAALASGLTLGLGFDDWRLGGVSAASAIVVGEAQFWLQPMGAVDALQSYTQGRLAIATGSGPVLSVGPSNAGIGIGTQVRF